jgi:hypothetical protein
MIRWLTVLLALLVSSQCVLAADRPELSSSSSWTTCAGLHVHRRPSVHQNANLRPHWPRGRVLQERVRHLSALLPRAGDHLSPARTAIITASSATPAKYSEPSHKLDTYHRHLQIVRLPHRPRSAKWHMGVDDFAAARLRSLGGFQRAGALHRLSRSTSTARLTKTTGYVTDVITDYAVDFIKSDHKG